MEMAFSFFEIAPMRLQAQEYRTYRNDSNRDNSFTYTKLTGNPTAPLTTIPNQKLKI